jgi:xyloglucan-specific exo-beta-1,4-glucanase
MQLMSYRSNQDKNMKAFLSSALLVLSVFITQAQTYNWGSLPVGGAGFVTGIITCASDPNHNIYARTDVGGAYRWVEADKSWKSITDWVPESSMGYQGVESMAIDPQSPNKIYMYCGTSYWNSGKSAILYSNDYGETWTEKTNVTASFPAHGNDAGRQTGERLAVDPNLGSELLCGSRTRGLWKSTNSGNTWSRIGATTFLDNVKIAFVQFIPSSGTLGNATPTIYVGVMQKNTNNLFVSTDYGVTWTAVTGQTTTYMPHRCLLSNNKLYVTYSDAEGPGGNAGAIMKYNLADKTWATISPSALSFGEVTVDPTNPDYLMCTTQGHWLKQSWITGTDTYGDQIYISKNDGSTWTNLFPSGCTYTEPDVVWLQKSSQLHWAGSAKIDPSNRNRAFIISGNGIYTTENLWDAKPSWRMSLKGIEETVPNDLVSLPGSPVATVIGDYDGFLYSDITKYYARHTPSMGSSTGIDIAGKNLQRMVRVGGSTGNAIYQTSNGGTTWTKITVEPSAGAIKGSCAISAGGNIIVWTPDAKTTYYTTNNGTSWTAMPGISSTNIRFFADYAADNTFYAVVSGMLRTYTYNTGTSTFAYTSTSLTSTVNNRLTVVPGYAGDIWAPKGSSGLARITNATSATPSITNFALNTVTCVGVGKAAAGKTYPSLYIWGKPTLSDATGLYRSDDEAQTWVRINDNLHQFGGPGNAQFVKGDMTVFGRVYMSTVGRGIIVGEYIDSATPVETAQQNKNIDIGCTAFDTSLPVTSKEIVNYQIFSATGACMEQGRFWGDKNVGERLKPGIYILSVCGNSDRLTVKIVKKK